MRNCLNENMGSSFSFAAFALISFAKLDSFSQGKPFGKSTPQINSKAFPLGKLSRLRRD